MREIELYDYQAEAVEALRQTMREGKRRVILVAATAFGKTECAAHIIKESMKKGFKAWFIVDRITLIDQTSQRFHQYGIDHGIIQADNIMTDPSKQVQIASAQTLSRRKIDEYPSLLVVDECHAQYAKVVELCEKATNSRVIGLTATPFTAGMDKNWDGFVNGITVDKLLEMGRLCPVKIRACVAPDMAGAKISFTGEYDEEDAGQRGITIVGDVVSTWIAETKREFGGPVKTIVFSPSVRHGEELCKAFADAGYNFQQISYLDKSDKDRRDKIEEFRKPDSVIDGLVSCAVLTKGFDVPSVKCGISCRPYRKSLSSHIQEVGRIMRVHPDKTHALWIDHSGNAHRFAPDMIDLYSNGVSELSSASKADSKPREQEEKVKREYFCADCGTMMPPASKVCASCGWERKPLKEIEVVDGEVVDLDLKREVFKPRQGLRADCLKDPMNVWNAALHYCNENTSKGPDAARKWAYGVWAGIYPGAKLPSGRYNAQINHKIVTPEQYGLIDREVRRFRKSFKKKVA